MRRSLTAALGAVLLAGAPLAAQPVASLPSGFTFVDWLSTGRTETVGIGDIDTRSVVYFVKEKQIGSLQSWYLFFDPSGSQSVNGTVTFDGAIDQIITETSALQASQATWGLASGITYGYVAATGFEGPDGASFAGDVLTFNFTASDPGDHMRILTAVPEPSQVPEPSALGLLALGAVVVAARRRTSAA
jgi:hypothetical protein